jgi:GcrA cell cycle regulator
MAILSDWTEERTGRLERLHSEGLSFSLIAADIGVTRSAAIGKAHRMQLPRRSEIVQCKARGAPVRHSPKAKVVAMKTAKRPEIIPGHDYRCTICDLKDDSCRYPLWETNTPHEAQFYCGVPDASLVAGVPYCRNHAALCGVARPL